MHLEKEAQEYIAAIFNKFEEDSGFKYKVVLNFLNGSLLSKEGVDHSVSGGVDVTISAKVTFIDDGYISHKTLFMMKISELPSCGIAVVSDLKVGGVARDYWPKKLKELSSFDYKPLRDMFNSIFGIFTVMELSMYPPVTYVDEYTGETRDRMRKSIVTSRYGAPYSLVFMGNTDLENDIYKAVGFVKTVPYYNTRYEPKSRYIYVYDSRKEEHDRKNNSFDKAITINTARTEVIKIDRPDAKSDGAVQEVGCVSTKSEPDVEPVRSNVKRGRKVQDPDRHEINTGGSRRYWFRASDLRKQQRHNGMVRANQRR